MTYSLECGTVRVKTFAGDNILPQATWERGCKLVWTGATWSRTTQDSVNHWPLVSGSHTIQKEKDIQLKKYQDIKLPKKKEKKKKVSKRREQNYESTFYIYIFIDFPDRFIVHEYLKYVFVDEFKWTLLIPIRSRFNYCDCTFKSSELYFWTCSYLRGLRKISLLKFTFNMIH